MCCSKKKFVPKSIPLELETPVSFSINETNFVMSNLDGLKSNDKSLAPNNRDVLIKTNDVIKLVDELQEQKTRIQGRLKLV